MPVAGAIETKRSFTKLANQNLPVFKKFEEAVPINVREKLCWKIETFTYNRKNTAHLKTETRQDVSKKSFLVFSHRKLQNFEKRSNWRFYNHAARVTSEVFSWSPKASLHPIWCNCSQNADFDGKPTESLWEIADSGSFYVNLEQ